MSTLEKIADLRIVDRHPGYDKVNNPQRLSVAELAPVGLTWQSGGVQHAVVEGPYDPSANRAYIVNADGSLRAQIPAQIGGDRVMFYDVIEANGSVAFLAAAPGRDVRIEVREADGAIVQVTESR
jgi:hypothetical protein